MRTRGDAMRKYISIIMATIIMLTVGVNTEMIASAKTGQTITASVKAKSSPHTNKKKKKKKHKHSMPKGNMKKWFKSKKALKKYVSSVMRKYNCLYENGEITWKEYVHRCPCGYEAWPYSCGKWTGNFKYNKG